MKSSEMLMGKSAFGLLDMGGSMWQYTADLSTGTNYSMQQPGVHDPIVPWSEGDVSPTVRGPAAGYGDLERYQAFHRGGYNMEFEARYLLGARCAYP